MTQQKVDSAKSPSSQPDSAPHGMKSAWAVALQQYDRAADLLNLGTAVREVLRYPKREVTVHFPVQLDDGTSRVFTGYRVWHNLARGPAKGGIRFHLERPRGERHGRRMPTCNELAPNWSDAEINACLTTRDPAGTDRQGAMDGHDPGPLDHHQRADCRGTARPRERDEPYLAYLAVTVRLAEPPRLLRTVTELGVLDQLN